MLKVGNYVSTYDEENIHLNPLESLMIEEEVRKKVEKRFEQIIRKAKNYSIYFYQIIQSQMMDSRDDDDVFYGLYFSRMRMEVDMTMDAAAAVGFDLYTKTKVAADDPNLTPEEREKAINGQLYKTLNTEEYFIVFNPIKMALFSREERIAIVKHEIHHMLRLHHLRMFDENFKNKTKEEINIENIVLDKEINGTFDVPGIRNLSGTKGHAPHVYPAVVKESYFVPAYKKGLITEKQLEEILTTDISAERMKEYLMSILEKDPDFLKDLSQPKDNNQSRNGQSQGQGQQKSGQSQQQQGDGLNGTDDIDDIPDDNLSPEEMKERIKDLKKQIEEIDKVLNNGNSSQQQQDNNQQQSNGQQQKEGNDHNNNQQQQGNSSQNDDVSQDDINDSSQTQTSQNQQGQQGQQESSQNKNNSQNQKGQSQQESAGKQEQQSQGQGQEEISNLKKEYDKLVSDLAKKMTEAYMKGLLRGDLDNHNQFVRNIPKGLDGEMVKRKSLEKMQDMIIKTREEFDFERPKSRGYMPHEFKQGYENVVNLLKPQNNYKQLLRGLIRRAKGLKSGKKSTYDVRSLIAPFDPNIKGKKKSKKPPIAMIIDVSGSMSDTEILIAYGEIIGIIQEEVKKGGAALRVIQADTNITMDELLENPKKKDIAKIMKRTGSGGTYMEPAIKRALGIGTSLVKMPNGRTVEVSNKRLLAQKSLGVIPGTVFVVTDGWIENGFDDIVPYGMPKRNNQSYLPPDVEIIWIVTGDFGNNPKTAREKAGELLAFDYKPYGKQMKVIAVDKKTILKQLQGNKKINNISI